QTRRLGAAWTVSHSNSLRSSRLGMVLILGLYFTLALGYNVADPVFEAPDEILHFNIVGYLLDHHALPVVRLDEPPSEYHQPPLYYVAAAVLTGWVPRDDAALSTIQNPFWAYDIGSVGRDNKNRFLHGPAQDFPYQGTVLAVHL